MPERKDNKIVIHSISLLCFLGSLICMLIASINKSWITIVNEVTNEEFQRGLGHDCFNSTSGIQCHSWQWKEENGSKFPPPFDDPTAPGFGNTLIVWFSRLLILIGVIWFGITFSCCCCWKNCKENMKKYLRLLVAVQIAGVVLFLLLGLVVLIAACTSDIVKELPSDYTTSTGSGFKTFFFGGLFCYFLGSCAFFLEQIIEYRQEYARRRGGHHQGIPLEESSKI